MNLISGIFSLLFGVFAKGEGATKAAGIGNGLAFYGALAGAALWLFGPGREWQITLNALELSAVALGGSLALEIVRRLPPPSAAPPRYLGP